MNLRLSSLRAFAPVGAVLVAATLLAGAAKPAEPRAVCTTAVGAPTGIEIGPGAAGVVPGNGWNLEVRGSLEFDGYLAYLKALEEIDIEDVDLDDPAFESLLVGRKVKVLGVAVRDGKLTLTARAENLLPAIFPWCSAGSRGRRSNPICNVSTYSARRGNFRPRPIPTRPATFPGSTRASSSRSDASESVPRSAMLDRAPSLARANDW